MESEVIVGVVDLVFAAWAIAIHSWREAKDVGPRVPVAFVEWHAKRGCKSWYGRNEIGKPTKL